VGSNTLTHKNILKSKITHSCSFRRRNAAYVQPSQ